MLWHTARETWCEITISMSDFPFSIFDWKSMVLCRVHCARRRKFFFSNHLTALQCINSLKLLHMLLVPTEAHFNAMRRLTIRSVLFDLGMMRSTHSRSLRYIQILKPSNINFFLYAIQGTALQVFSCITFSHYCGGTCSTTYHRCDAMHYVFVVS